MRGFRGSRAAKNFRTSHFGKLEHRPNGAIASKGDDAQSPGQESLKGANNLPSWVKVPQKILKMQEAQSEQARLEREARQQHEQTASPKQERPIAPVLKLPSRRKAAKTVQEKSPAKSRSKAKPVAAKQKTKKSSVASRKSKSAA